MKNLFYVFTAALLILASCSNEEMLNANFSKNGVITAVMEQSNSSSRVTIANDNSLAWAGADIFKIFAGQGTYVYKHSQGNQFVPSDESNVLPANATVDMVACSANIDDCTFGDNALNIKLSELIEVTAGNESYSDIPMRGTYSDGTVTFQHLVGILRVNLNGLPEGYNQMTIEASSPIAGEFVADFSTNNQGVVLKASEGNDTKKVEIQFEAPTTNSNKTLYLPLPVGTYESIKLTAQKVEMGASSATTISESKVLANWTNKEVKCGYIYTAIATCYTFSSIADANTSLSTNLTEQNKNVHVTITEEITSSSQAVTVPCIEGSSVTLNFTAIGEGAVLTVNSTDTSITPGESVQKIAIQVPDNASITTLSINTPLSSVEVNGTDVTVAQINAITATSTLIIGSGVTVTTVEVGGGHVVIEEEANVEMIKPADNYEGNIYVVDKRETPTDLGDDVTVLGSEEELDLNVSIDSESESVYQLTEDVILTEPLVVPAGKTLTIDLNGYTISQKKECTGSYSMIENKGTLTIKDTSSEGNGKISFKDISAGDPTFGWGSYTIRNEGTLTVENGTIEHLGEQAFATHMICAIFQYSGSSTINGGVISTPAYRSARLWKGDMTITDGTFDGQLWVQSVDNSAKLTISGGTFGPNGNDGSSVFIGNVTTTNVHHSVDFNVTDGNFETKIGCNDAEKLTGSRITGGIFTESAKTNTNSALIAEGCAFEANADGTYTLSLSFVKVNETSYQIHNVAGLKLFRDAVNNGNKFDGCTIELMDNLDLKNENWTPIGFNSNDEAGDENYFGGTFDGKNYTISNLKIDVTDKGGVGFFGAVYNATFKNFTLNNVDIKAVESESDPANSSGAEGKSNYIVGGHMGAVVGYDAKAGTLSFENVHVTGLIKIEGETRAAQGQRIGGIIGGRSSSNVSFDNVTVKGSEGSYIKGYCSTAGVMGQHQSTGTFTNVHTDIDIHAVTFGAGGIVGIARQGSTFTNCSSAGDIVLDASKTQLSSYSANYPYRVGGIAGCWSESSTGELTLTGCSYTGTLTSIDKDGNMVNSFDYTGYVGRGYTLNGCQGSKVVINGVEYVQAYNTAAQAGIYYIDGLISLASGVVLNIDGEYVISNADGMIWLANEVNTGNNYFAGKTVKLANDIDLNNEEWTPIGSATKDHGFMGNFDGNSYAIKNLKMTKLSKDADGYVYAGLFGVTEGTDANNENYIKNLTIENVNIELDGQIVAAAIAYPYYTDIDDITVKGNINIKGGDYTAGVLAYTRRCVNAKNLAIEGNDGSSIEGGQTVGGVISDIQMNGGLTASYSNFVASGLTIKGTKCVGGISGIISSQTLDGATVKNVTIDCEDVRRGTVSGALGGTSTIKNISVDNVTGAEKVVGATYEGGAEVTASGDVYEKAETNAGE